MSDIKKVIYYKDELNDDFSGSKIEQVKIDGKYKYIHKNIFWNISATLLYRIIALPLAYIYSKIKFGVKVIGREKFKKCKDEGYFVYINHTQEILDTLTPALTTFPKRAYIIAHPNNVSIKGMKTINKMLGAIPIPGDIESSKNFLDVIQKYIKKKNVIAVYPEAHIWPYYTKIRNFKEVSFRYPVKLNCPVYSITITYKEWKNDKPKIIEYVDGPFYPDNDKKAKEAEKLLRDKVYETMVNRSKESNFEYIKYIKKEEGKNHNV